MSCPARVRLLLVAAPLRWQHVAASGVETERRVVLVEWTAADGTSGWGECPTLAEPGYVLESTAAAWAGLRDHLVPQVFSGTWPDGGRFPAAAAALADARLDAQLRASGVSLRAHLGATRRSVRWTAVVAAIDSGADECAARAVEAVRDGASMVKVKVRPGADVDVLTAVREAVGAVPVAADANGSYPSPESIAGVDDLGLAYLEQPMTHEASWEDLARVRSALETPVALDESIRSPEHLAAAVAIGAADIVSVKPARVGGIAAAASMASAAEAAGLGVFVGGMLELGIGRAGALAVAALDACGLPTDLGPTRRYVNPDVTADVVTDAGGSVVLPEGAGIGTAPDPDRLESMSIDEIVIER